MNSSMNKIMSAILFLVVMSTLVADATPLRNVPGLTIHYTHTSDTIVFKVSLEESNKWVAIGLSASGTMKHSNIYKFDPKDQSLTSFFSQGNGQIERFDAPFVLLDAIVNDGKLEFSFSIPRHNCDDPLMSIADIERWLIYAVGESTEFKQHRHTDRGSVLVNLLKPYAYNSTHEDLLSVSVTTPKTEISSTEVETWNCVILETPEADIFVRGFQPILETETLHHMLMFLCDPLLLMMNKKEFGQVSDCISMDETYI